MRITGDVVTVVEQFVTEVVARYPEQQSWFGDCIEARRMFRDDYGH